MINCGHSNSSHVQKLSGQTSTSWDMPTRLAIIDWLSAAWTVGHSHRQILAQQSDEVNGGWPGREDKEKAVKDVLNGIEGKSH